MQRPAIQTSMPKLIREHVNFFVVFNRNKFSLEDKFYLYNSVSIVISFYVLCILVFVCNGQIILASAKN
jgi:hypothetical protein